MNTEIKSRINTIGTVGRILTIIAIVVVIAALVCTTLATIVSVAFPRNALSITLSGDAQIQLSSRLYSGRLPVLGLGDLQENRKLELGDIDLNTVSVEETADGLRIRAATEQMQLDNMTLFRACLVGVVYLSATLVMLYFLKALMTEFKTCDSPFAEGVIKKMTNFGWSLVPMAVLSGVSGSWGSLIFNNIKEFNYTINLSVVLVVVIVLVLVQIFKYGAQLQQQSDETL